MINKTILRVGSAVALALTAYGCNNDSLTALNRNPNSPEDVPPGPLFTEAARLTTSRWFGAIDLRAHEWIVQQLAEVQYNDEDRYIRVHATDTEGSWNGAYSSELKDLTQIIAKGEASGDAGVYAPAIALQTLGFDFITDSWGDAPYSQALKGDSVGSSLTPAYDTQQDIYASFFAALDKASTDLNGASNALGSADPIYGGRPAAWQKFINSLRARLAMRVSNVDQALGTAQLRAAMAATGGLILSNADNAYFPWPGDGVYDNPWDVSLKARDDWRMSWTLVDSIMKPLNDPRLPIYAQPRAGHLRDPNNPTSPCDPDVSPTYHGAQNGITAILPPAGTLEPLCTTSRPGSIFYPGATTYGPVLGSTGATLPTVILTAAEMNFILAEAAERGMISGSAAAYYNAGITASMNQWNDLAQSNGQSITDPQTAAYLAQASIVYKGSTAGLAQIAREKYVALYTDGGNAWFEWRRTCVPMQIRPGPDHDPSVTTVPRRWEYPTTEATSNGESLAAAIAAQGTDNLMTQLWWDTKTAATCS